MTGIVFALLYIPAERQTTEAEHDTGRRGRSKRTERKRTMYVQVGLGLLTARIYSVQECSIQEILHDRIFILLIGLFNFFTQPR